MVANPRLAILLRKLRRAGRAEVLAWATRSPIRRRTVLYESFAGNGMLDNPEAIFRELLTATDLGNLRHIWVVADAAKKSPFITEFARHPRVSFVAYRSARYFSALSRSEYLVNNATFPAEFSKRSGQIYVNTWHGTPLKHMGYDMPNGALESANTLRNFMAADFLLSQNSFMTEQMYERAYELRGAFVGRIVEEGYPRVDRQFLDQSEFLEARARLENAGLRLEGRNVVLYAPTWKGDSFTDAADDAAELLATVTELQARLGSDDYVVLLKTHQVVHHYAANFPLLHDVLVPNDIPTNVILGLCSALVTDYSSIFIDFLASDRPIVFYTPDADAYQESRGTYFASDELPGYVYNELALVASALSAQMRSPDAARPHPNYAAWKQRFTAFDDGKCAARVVDAVFRGRINLRRVFSISHDSRTSLLIHLGGMRANGITSSALNLLDSIDHDRYDVSIIIRRPRGEQQLANQARIHPRVRQFHRVGGMSGHKLPHAARKLAERFGLATHHANNRAQAKLWDAEWRRCFGEIRFDSVADFSGYSPFWATLLLHSPGGTRSIWLHNDMAADELRIIGGRQRMRTSLRSVFALYPQFDRLVSVSKALSAVNRVSLASRFKLDPTSFVHARNLIDSRRILDRMHTDLIDSVSTKDEDGSVVIPPWATELTTGTAGPWFLSVGRYSPEKNYARLIRAFARVHAEHPSARLLLVGYGPLAVELASLVDELGLQHAATLTGPLANPYPIMAATDCFVLSSDYEGQPMVLLEAATVGMPIVSVAFATVRDALPAGEIHVVDQTVPALARGMSDYIEGRVTPARLDGASYRAAALHEALDLLIPKMPHERPPLHDSSL